MPRPLLRWLPALVIAGTIMYTLSVYPSLPARMPTHWGINGQPNGWSSRELGAWLLPAIMVAIGIMFQIVPKIDPRKENYERFGVVYDVVVTAILAFQAAIQYAMLNIALGHAIDINTLAYVGLGALFIVLGLAMPSTKPTWFFGIRTPWTLSDDSVWERTHRTGGFLLATAGVLTIVAALTASPMVTFTVMVSTSLAAAAGSILVSYLYWRRR